MKTLSYVMMVATVASISFSSCKKSSTPAPAATTSMKLTVNGTDLSFNQCGELQVDINDAPQTTITGINVTNGNPGDASFEVDIDHDLATLKAGQTYQASSSYVQPDGVNFYYSPTSTGDFSSQPANPQGSVTITAVTATTISGTFSCKLFDASDFSGTTVVYTVTNGSFTAKINK